MELEKLIGKVFTYVGDYEPYKGKKVEVAYLHDTDSSKVVVCDCDTTESFFSATPDELID